MEYQMTNRGSANYLSPDIAGAQACSPKHQLLEHLNSSAPSLDGRSRTLNQKLASEIRQKSNGAMVTLSPVLRVTLDFHREVHSPDWHNAVRCLAGELEAYKLVLGSFLPQTLLEQAEQRIRQNAYEEGTNPNAALDLPEFFSRVDRRETLVTHFPTGIDRLDHDLYGGVGGLTFLLGDKGVGKTALLLSCIMATLEDPDVCVLFYSLDMPKDEIYSRIWCRELRTPFRALQQDFFRNPDNRQVIDGVTAKMHRLNVVERDYSITHSQHDDTASLPGMSCRNVLDESIKLVNETGARKLLIVVDLFQKMITPSSVVVSEVDTYRLDIFNQLTLSQSLIHI